MIKNATATDYKVFQDTYSNQSHLLFMENKLREMNFIFSFSPWEVRMRLKNHGMQLTCNKKPTRLIINKIQKYFVSINIPLELTAPLQLNPEVSKIRYSTSGYLIKEIEEKILTSSWAYAATMNK